MALVRFIDLDGLERDVADVPSLLALSQAGRINYDSLVRDQPAGVWMKAADHPLFRRIHEIASQQPPMIDSPSIAATGAMVEPTRPPADITLPQKNNILNSRWLLAAAGAAALILGVVAGTPRPPNTQQTSRPVTQPPGAVPNNDWLKDIPELYRRKL